MPDWPEWWEWELVLTEHLLTRMLQRGFTEVDLRVMMEGASGLSPSVEYGRWVVTARHGNRRWAVVVEPETQKRLLKVLTAYEVD